MSRSRLLLIILFALGLTIGCGLSPVPDLPSLTPGDGEPGFGTGGATGTGGSTSTGGAPGYTGGDNAPDNNAPDQNLGGAIDDTHLLGGLGGQG